MSKGDGYETVDEKVGDIPKLEEEEDSFADTDGTSGTKSDQESGTKWTGMVGKRVKVVTRSGRRAARVVYGKRYCTRGGRVAGIGRHPSQIRCKRYAKPYHLVHFPIFFPNGCMISSRSITVKQISGLLAALGLAQLDDGSRWHGGTLGLQEASGRNIHWRRHEDFVYGVCQRQPSLLARNFSCCSQEYLLLLPTSSASFQHASATESHSVQGRWHVS